MKREPEPPRKSVFFRAHWCTFDKVPDVDEVQCLTEEVRSFRVA